MAFPIERMIDLAVGPSLVKTLDGWIPDSEACEFCVEHDVDLIAEELIFGVEHDPATSSTTEKRDEEFMKFLKRRQRERVVQP